MARPAPYSYSDAGFNGFFRRTLMSNPHVNTLSSTRNRSQQLNFDDLQTSGALGDRLRVGRIIINGKAGRLEVEDENGTPVIWIGNVDG